MQTLKQRYLSYGVGCDKKKLPMQCASIVKVRMFEPPMLRSPNELQYVCLQEHFLQEDNILHS